MKNEQNVMALLTSLEDNQLTRTQQSLRDQILADNIELAKQTHEKAIELGLDSAVVRIGALIARVGK